MADYTPPPMGHNIHPDTKHRYACYNREPVKKVKYQMQDGWTADGRRNMVEHVTEWKDITCGHHGYKASDPACSGCKWR